jgi:hypothetical protein
MKSSQTFIMNRLSRCGSGEFYALLKPLFSGFLLSLVFCSLFARAGTIQTVTQTNDPQKVSETGQDSGKVSPVTDSSWSVAVIARGDFVEARLDEKLFAPAVAGQTGRLNLNLSGKTEFFNTHRLQADIDLFARQSWNFKNRERLTKKILVSQQNSSENPAYRLLLNEIYANGEPVSGLQYTLGKKRILWGTGFAANPTDLLNPAKNPLDPTYERRGAWLFQLENIQEKQTFAGFFAPEVLEDKNSLPQDIGVLSEGDGRRRVHFLTGVRWYQLVSDADLNLMVFYSERFREQISGALSAGASWSQIATSISKQLETHAEALVRQGSNRGSSTGESRLESNKLFVRVLFGGRYDFENESSFVFEWLHQSDGDSMSDVQTRLRRQFDLVRRNPTLVPSESSPVVMKNMLFLNYQRYKFTDDLFLSWSIAHNLHDQSGFQGPLLQWTPNQSLSLTVAASTDYNLTKNSVIEIPNAGSWRTNELNPVKSRLGVEIKSYF